MLRWICREQIVQLAAAVGRAACSTTDRR